jgi:hypothetical protein
MTPGRPSRRKTSSPTLAATKRTNRLKSARSKVALPSPAEAVSAGSAGSDASGSRAMAS